MKIKKTFLYSSILLVFGATISSGLLLGLNSESSYPIVNKENISNINNKSRAIEPINSKKTSIKQDKKVISWNSDLFESIFYDDHFNSFYEDWKHNWYDSNNLYSFFQNEGNLKLMFNNLYDDGTTKTNVKQINLNYFDDENCEATFILWYSGYDTNGYFNENINDTITFKLRPTPGTEISYREDSNNLFSKLDAFLYDELKYRTNIPTNDTIKEILIKFMDENIDLLPRSLWPITQSFTKNDFIIKSESINFMEEERTIYFDKGFATLTLIDTHIRSINNDDGEISMNFKSSNEINDEATTIIEFPEVLVGLENNETLYNENNLNIGLIAGAIGGSVALLILVLIVYLIVKKKKKSFKRSLKDQIQLF